MFASDRLPDWLTYIESLHEKVIDMGLSRVSAIKQIMGLQPVCPVIMVAGTNGKGSVCAMLSAMLVAAGYRVGTYTSPHLLRYNERVAIDLQPVDDRALVASFAAVDAARAEQPLSFFEFATLAAVDLFMKAGVDVMVLEVGLGGRLDAVNVFEPDVSVVVSVDLDHQAFLGNDRESIGHEKAGIFRAGKPAICADPQPPQRLIDHAAAIGAPLYLTGRDYSWQRMDLQWSFAMGERHWRALPMPALRGSYQLANASAALAVLSLLHERLPMDLGAIKRGLLEVEWPGRFQVLPGRPQVVLDVGHNPHAVAAMVSNLNQLPFANQRYAVFSMLADKDLAAVAALAADAFDVWLVAGLAVPRGQRGAEIAAQLAAHGVKEIEIFDQVAGAWAAALSRATESDRIVAFGSFFTVAEVMLARRNEH